MAGKPAKEGQSKGGERSLSKRGHAREEDEGFRRDGKQSMERKRG